MTNAVIKNGTINSDTVRLSVDGETEIITLSEAIARADDEGLDLIVVSEKSNPPVCRIGDYSKFKYENDKRAKESKKASRKNSVEIKEIQLRPVTDVRDIQIKAKKASGFLDKGDKVRVVVRFKGRENSHKELGKTIIETFFNSVGEHEIDSPLNDIGRDLSVVIKRTK